MLGEQGRFRKAVDQSWGGGGGRGGRGVEIYRAISKCQADLVIFNVNIQGIVETVNCMYTIIEKTVTKPVFLLVLNF